MNVLTLKQLYLASVGFLFHVQLNAAIEGKLITCACTTHDCQVSLNVSTCSTTSLCFTQLLDRRDGNGLVIRGCIDTRTPLLCENKPPAVPGHKWPVLLCCNTSLCNQIAVPTVPTWYHANRSNITVPDEHMTSKRVFNNIVTIPYAVQDNTMVSAKSIESIGHQRVQNDEVISSSAGPGLISPLHMMVIAVGVAILVIIGVVATCILRRQRRYYTRHHWITIGSHHDYIKGQSYLPPSTDINFIKPHSSVNGLMMVNAMEAEEDNNHKINHDLYDTSVNKAFIHSNSANCVLNTYVP